MGNEAGTRVTPQLVVGVFLTLLGIVLTLDRLHVLQLRLFWPIALIALGSAMLLQKSDRRGRFWGTFWTVVGGWMLLNAIGVFQVTLWQLLGPLVLIFIGANVMMQTFRDGPSRWEQRLARRRERWERRAARHQARWDQNVARVQEQWGGAQAGTPGVPPIPDASAPPGATPLQSDPTGRVTLFAVLGGAKRASNDNPFRGGEMTAFMGGCVLDLRQATIPAGEDATINVLAVMAGHEIWVPQGWMVVSDIVPVLGGVDDKRLPPVEPLPPSPPRLHVRGVVLMGGLVIKN